MNTETKDARTKDLLAMAEAKFGFVPNVLREMSVSPAALEVYLRGQAALGNPDNRLSDRDRNMVQLAVSGHFGCDYCATAHSGMAKGLGSDPATIEAARTGGPVPDSEGGAYVEATRLLLAKNGNLDAADLTRLEAQGIDRAILFELIGSIAVKLVSNWVNHIAETKLDPQFT